MAAQVSSYRNAMPSREERDNSATQSLHAPPAHVLFGKGSMRALRPSPNATKPWCRQKLAACSSLASTTSAYTATSDRLARSMRQCGACPCFSPVSLLTDLLRLGTGHYPGHYPEIEGRRLGVYSLHAGCQNGNPDEIGKSKEIVIYVPPIQTKRACIGAIPELKGRILWVSLSITEARTGGSVLISGSHLTAPQARRLPGC